MDHDKDKDLSKDAIIKDRIDRYMSRENVTTPFGIFLIEAERRRKESTRRLIQSPNQRPCLSREIMGMRGQQCSSGNAQEDRRIETNSSIINPRNTVDKLYYKNRTLPQSLDDQRMEMRLLIPPHRIRNIGGKRDNNSVTLPYRRHYQYILNRRREGLHTCTTCVNRQIIKCCKLDEERVR